MCRACRAGQEAYMNAVDQVHQYNALGCNLPSFLLFVLKEGP
jgi:hypothetical protein